MNAIIAVNPQQMQEADPGVEIQLTKGKVAIVSPEDFERISRFKWSAALISGVWRAFRKCGKKTVYMHRTIMNAPPSRNVDHRDGDGLNNRRKNLRLCTQTQNMCNTKIKSNKKSDAPKGVSWDKRRGKWVAEIKLGETRERLGRFSLKEDAISVRAEAEKRLHGEFARQFPISASS